jgi:single-strand DNA-binding protein
MLKALLIGNVGSDPEMKFTPNGQPMLRFSVASNYRVRDTAGQWSDATEWVRVTLFGKRAESLQAILAKGTRVYCDGRLEARPWTDRSGNVQAGLELVANDVEFASNRQDDGQQQRRPAAAGQGQNDDLEDAF